MLAAELGDDTARVTRALREDPQHCADLTRRISADAGRDSRVVLVVDQFEQTFAGCGDDLKIDRFVTALHAASSAAGALVVLGLRADFYARVLNHPQLAQAVRDHQVAVGPITEPELREVLAKPAQKAGIEVEAALVERLLGDAGILGRRAGHETGTLPLMSHVLYTTWERRQHGRLTLAKYLELGGLEGAVAGTANVVYHGLTPAQQTLARRMFFSLVRVGPGTADTRRRLPVADLLAKLGTEGLGTEVEDVLDRFLEQRLLVVDADTVEITHDALLTAWPARTATRWRIS